MDKPGGIFVRRGEQMSEEDRVLLQTVARVIVRDSAGTLAEQVERGSRRSEVAGAHARAAARSELGPRRCRDVRGPDDLASSTASGGFTHDGASTSSSLGAEQPHAGAVGQRDRQPALRHRRHRERQRLHLVREQPRVPPHSLAQRPGQRRQRRGDLPPRRGNAARSGRPRRCRRRGPMPYTSRHGFGYSVFEYAEDGIVSEL